MAPEAFWKFRVWKERPYPGWGIYIYSQDGVYGYSGDLSTPTDVHELGKLILRYAYSTPAGTAYRLTYGVPKP